MTAKLELRNLTKRFDGVNAVQDLSLAIAQGQFLSLLGPSGCGKSTTLAMVAGFETPDSGDILIDQKRVNALPPQGRGVGLVFQDYAVFTRLSVKANLAFGLEVQHAGTRERRQKVQQLSERLGLSAILDKRGADLNVSEMQRVALARVLITEPAILLLDEPMSNLDAAIRTRLRNELKQLQTELGQTVFYVTHDQSEALSMSDQVAVMNHGRLAQIGTPDEIYDFPANRFVASFIGDPPMNLFSCKLAPKDGRVFAITPTDTLLDLGPTALEARELWVGIRPQDIPISPEESAGSEKVRVQFIENFGSENILHVQYGRELLSIAAIDDQIRAGDAAYIKLDARRLHLFRTDGEESRIPTRHEGAQHEGARHE